MALNPRYYYEYVSISIEAKMEIVDFLFVEAKITLNEEI